MSEKLPFLPFLGVPLALDVALHHPLRDQGSKSNSKEHLWMQPSARHSTKHLQALIHLTSQQLCELRTVPAQMRTLRHQCGRTAAHGGLQNAHLPKIPDWNNKGKKLPPESSSVREIQGKCRPGSGAGTVASVWSPRCYQRSFFFNFFFFLFSVHSPTALHRQIDCCWGSPKLSWVNRKRPVPFAGSFFA